MRALGLCQLFRLLSAGGIPPDQVVQMLLLPRVQALGSRLIDGFPGTKTLRFRLTQIPACWVQLLHCPHRPAQPRNILLDRLP